LNLRGFSLVEMLVVMGILLLLAVLTIGATGRFQETGKQVATASRLRQVHMLQMAYAQDHGGQLTAFWSSAAPLTWQEKLLPYLNRVNVAGAKEDPKLILNSPYQKIQGGRFWFQEGRSFGLNNFMADTVHWNYRMVVVPEPSKIILAGDMVQGNNDFLNTSDGQNWYGGTASWGRPAYRHAGQKRAMMVFLDGHTELLDEGELKLARDDGEPSLWRWW
jgi:prepilin-type N-terminal cleavage/methylation domain-containing protein/prepilin-type processing-associated H-X9-DG protein